MTNIEKIRQEIERRAKFHDNAMKACPGLNNIALTHSAGWKEDTELLSFIDSLPEEKLTWQDIKKIVNIADALLSDPKARVEYNNHNEEYYYKKVLDEYNRLHQTAGE